ncbi:MAG: TIGR01212 family radical SAM protein [bacterium]|nr:TIGR01212 family radical SAM protein [bacterium]
MNYNSLNAYLRNQYGEKVYKLALNGGMTCPNRDGTLDTRGCIFCSLGGSGEFAESITIGQMSGYAETTVRLAEEDVIRRLEAAKQRLSGKKTGTQYIAYFQAYTNTYAPVEYLRSLFLPILGREDIVGISIGTRPDCLPEDVLELLDEMNRVKPVWVELGLQTIHEDTAKLIRRGYELPCFDHAVTELRKRHIDVIVHLIFGLPGEGKADMIESVHYVNQSQVQGVKFQLLHILQETDLADLYAQQKELVRPLTMEEYIDILCDAVENLSPDIVIHRMTGDGPKKLLIAPMWSADKKRVLNAIRQEFVHRDICQGRALSV